MPQRKPRDNKTAMAWDRKVVKGCQEQSRIANKSDGYSGCDETINGYRVINMPDIRDKHTRQALARAYITTDRDKGEAMRMVGYSRSYSVGGMLTKPYKNPRLIAEIERIEVEEAGKNGYSIAKSHVEYEQARQHAIVLNQPSAEVSAITGKARLYGMDKDGGANAGDALPALSRADIDVLRAQAKELTKPRLSKETG